MSRSARVTVSTALATAAPSTATVSKRPGAKVIDFYKVLPKEHLKDLRTYKNYDLYRINIPNRILVIGKSGSGKTNAVMNLVLGMECFNRIYLFVKDQDESLYAFLIAEIRKIEKTTKRKILTVSSDMDDLPSYEDYDTNFNNLVIVDDMLNEKSKQLSKAVPLWTMGRKHNVTAIFVSQSYFATPIRIRQNTDVLIFKKLLARDLKLVMTEFTLDRSKDELLAMYRACNTNKVTDFFMIDSSPLQEEAYKYRHNFDPIG